MTSFMLELEMLLDLPIPIDQHLEIERAGRRAHEAGLHLKHCPYSISHMIYADDPRVPAVSAVSLWRQGWDNAWEDAQIARRSPTKGMWRR